MFYGIPVSTSMMNFYAWSPSDGSAIPEWIDDYFPNASVGNYIVYTAEPVMKKFLVGPDEVIIRCGLGSSIFFLILKKEMMQNWWKVNQQMAKECEQYRPLRDMTYQEYAEKNIF